MELGLCISVLEAWTPCELRVLAKRSVLDRINFSRYRKIRTSQLRPYADIAAQCLTIGVAVCDKLIVWTAITGAIRGCARR
jgi:hypothetical protein